MTDRPTQAWWGKQEHLELTRKGTELCGPCPHCGGDDRFHVRADGIFGCRVCGTFREILDAAGWVNGAGPRQKTRSSDNMIVDTLLANLGHQDRVDSWMYRTVAGERVNVMRKRGKGTRPWRDPKGVSGPYRPFSGYLHGPVVIGEGERACDALRAAGVNATCWIGGASSWQQTDWTDIAGRRVAIWPDADLVGEQAATGLKLLLEGIGCDVRTVDIPENVEPGWDAADTDKMTVIRLCEAALSDYINPEIFPEPINFDEPRPLDYVIDKILERGSLSVLFGRPGAGKSTLALAEAVSIAAGKDLLGLDPDIEAGKVGLYWPDEGARNAIRKIRGICAMYKLDIEQVRKNLFFIGGEGFPITANAGNIDALATQIIAMYSGFSALYIDSMAAFGPDIESDNSDATRVMRGLERVAEQTQCAIRLLHHSRKGPPGVPVVTGMEEARGASAVLGRASIVEQIIIRQVGSDRILSIGGPESDLKYRNTPAPERRLYKIISVDIDGEKYQPGVIWPTEEVDDTRLSQIMLPEAIMEAQARMLKLPDEQLRQSSRSSGWAGIGLAKILDMDIGEGLPRAKCSESQLQHRSQITQLLHDWTLAGLLTIEERPDVNRHMRKTYQ